MICCQQSHACLAWDTWFLVDAIDPASEMGWTINDKDRFLDIHRELSLFLAEESAWKDVHDFSVAAFQVCFIVFYQCHVLCNISIILESHW